MDFLSSVVDALSLIFADKAQQAQLISIGVSAFVALAFVLLNQWFLSRRARKEIYIKKIEELYLAINEYEDYSYEFISLLYDYEKNHDGATIGKHFNQVSTSIMKIEMYMKLHFYTVDFDHKIYLECHRKAYERLREERFNQLKSGYIENIRENAQTLKYLAKSLMKKYKH
ncbi:hypothetical protein [Vibrio metschnikovii]|uniref:hypothetical protein n=1 Tax=Vibrio metschnikovii TaxID=28172 RepID=UPI002FCBA05E